jgi:hypothetical protein
MRGKKSQQIGKEAARKDAETQAIEVKALPPKELGLVKRLSIRLNESQQISFANWSFENGLARPAEAFDWLLDRAVKPHLYIPLSEEMEAKVKAFAKAQGLDEATFVYNLILRVVLSGVEHDLSHALATGSPPQTSTKAKTNWAGEGKGEGEES